MSVRGQCYNSQMREVQPTPLPGASPDSSLIDWFTSLSPEQRLAELESRLGFFYSLRVNDESQLSRNSGTPE